MAGGILCPSVADHYLLHVFSIKSRIVNSVLCRRSPLVIGGKINEMLPVRQAPRPPVRGVLRGVQLCRSARRTAIGVHLHQSGLEIVRINDYIAAAPRSPPRIVSSRQRDHWASAR